MTKQISHNQTQDIKNRKTVAASFFEAYKKHDLDTAVSYTTADATFRYVPLGENGVGKINAEKGTSWKGIANALITAFPDLSNDVKSITVDNEGNAVVRVFIGGTQENEILGIPSQGKYYNTEHLFILKINDNNKIEDITCFWDNWDWFQQIGFNPGLN
ncbi:ester cyclase [Aquimarina gracilis]|uniref:Ester cyclase n=1 Tax=Aquimarina gracilis TaxID=874422 RepID=A0ABU5ZY57_9FLAO|nr:ester cyclase [Aquimarina gracilis]MEB3346762.1 ester cyclase [Aquimarina gracilis]